MHQYNSYGTLPSKSPDGGLQKWASEEWQLGSGCERVVGGPSGTRLVFVTPGVDGGAPKVT